MVEKNSFQELYPERIINIQAYKYNGFLYRQWSNARVISNSLTHVVVSLNGSIVKKYGTKSWRFSEPTIFVFPKKQCIMQLLLLNQVNILVIITI